MRWVAGAGLACLALAGSALALDNGVARTPPMGWNTWLGFGSDISEAIVLEAAGYLRTYHLQDHGYRLILLDDGWVAKERGADGRLQADPKKFPRGFKALADELHAQGFLVGIFEDAGHLTCGGAAGSLHHEVVDALTFASWGVDYLKYDNCYAEPKNGTRKLTVVERFEKMRDALKGCGRQIMFSMDDWGVTNPWEYGQGMANMWRTTSGIVRDGHSSAEWEDVLRVLDNNVGLARYAGPGGWNNGDMVVVGEPASENLDIYEQEAHFALWALLKFPLIIGADLRTLTKANMKILTSREVIAMNQDPLGVAGDLVWKQGPVEVWAGPLQGSARGVVLLNRHKDEDLHYVNSTMTVWWAHLGYPSDLEVTVRDLFAQKDLGVFVRNFTGRVQHHGVLALKLTPTKRDDAKYDAWRPWECGIFTGKGEQTCRDMRQPSSAWEYGKAMLPQSKPVLIGLCALLGVMALTIVGVLLAWRANARRYRKSYHKWNEELADYGHSSP